MRAFFDTNVIVYCHDRREGLKQSRAQALMEAHITAGTFVLSTQVLVESYNSLQKAALLSREAAFAIIELLSDEHVVTTDAALVLRGLRLSQRHRISHWDGLVVQAALDAGCEVLFTEDLQAGQRFGDLEIVDPFADAAHEPRAPHQAAATRKTVAKRKR